MSSLKARIENLEKQVKSLTKSIKDNKEEIKTTNKTIKTTKSELLKVIKKFKYIKTVSKACKRKEHVSEKLIRTKDGFAILGEVTGSFAGAGESVWLERSGGYWYLKAHSLQNGMHVTAFVFQYSLEH